MPNLGFIEEDSKMIAYKLPKYTVVLPTTLIGITHSVTMKTKTKILLLLTALILVFISFYGYINYFPGQPEIVSIRINPENVNISLYWKQSNGDLYENINTLRQELENQNKKLIFATNAGMFDKKQIPVGLYIENGKKLRPLNTKVMDPDKYSTIPNFHLNPNGVFYMTYDNKAAISKTALFPQDAMVKFATQSGPMLLIDGVINPIFKQDSKNFHIRNGVGILPDNELIFAISKNKVTFFDFANYFKAQGCTNALFLDGYVSKAYMPEKGVEQLDGELGVLIGITEK